MRPFLLVRLPELVFDICTTHDVRLLASAAEKRARLRNSAAFWQPVVTSTSDVTRGGTFGLELPHLTTALHVY